MKFIITVIVSVMFLLISSSASAAQYSYDDLGRLISVQYSNGQKITYVFDKAGNILSTEVTKDPINPPNREPRTGSGGGGGGGTPKTNDNIDKENQTVNEDIKIKLTIGSNKVLKNNTEYSLDAVPFVDIQVGRTLVPIRFIGESFGAEIEWEGLLNKVTIKDNDKIIVMTIGSNQVYINGEKHYIECPPIKLPPGRTYVPLRFISEKLGFVVDYDENTKSITISR